MSYLEAGYRCPETEGHKQHTSDGAPVRKDSVDEFEVLALIISS